MNEGRCGKVPAKHPESEIPYKIVIQEFWSLEIDKERMEEVIGRLCKHCGLQHHEGGKAGAGQVPRARTKGWCSTRFLEYAG